MSKRRKGVIIVLVIVVIAIILMVVFIGGRMREQTKSLPFSEISTAEVADGVYRGKAETALVKAEVEVTVEGRQIINIDILRHDTGTGQKAEAIVDQMQERNTWEVDGVSGATFSSEVIKSAVNQALESGRE